MSGDRLPRMIQKYCNSITAYTFDSRKIKWNSAVSDWDRRGDHTSTRIKVGIDLEELQLLGGVPLIHTPKEATTNTTVEEPYSSMADFSLAEGDEVDALEKKINKTYDTIKRIIQENDTLDTEVELLEAENQTLRQEIAAVPMGNNPTRKGVDQLCSLEKTLKKKLRELDRQCKLLKRRRNEIEQTKRKMRTEDGQDDAKSYSTQTSKSIVTLGDDSDSSEDADIQVFTTGKGDESDSDSSLKISSAEEEEGEIIEEVIEEEEEEEASLGSFAAAEEEELSECQSNLGDSLKDLPYEPSISLL